MAGIQINVSDMALTNEGQAICTQGPESPPGIDMFRVYTAGERWEIFRYQLGHILSSGCRYTGLVETAEFSRTGDSEHISKRVETGMNSHVGDNMFGWICPSLGRN